jgi:pimeloyl-ACP methyl ester carboxylesterase
MTMQTRTQSLLAAVLICLLAVTTANAQLAPKTKTTADIGVPGKGKEGIVKLADSSIEYFTRGQGETIVLLPGGTLTVGYLDGLADALAKAGYRVVGINFRGAGKSTGASEGVTLQTDEVRMRSLSASLG